MRRLRSLFGKRRRIVLHIGMPKCGSTTLQNLMDAHREENLAVGVCYPDTHRSPDSYRNHLPLMRLEASRLGEAVAAIRAEAADCHTIVLSCEDWTTAFPAGNLAQFCDVLASDMPEWELRVLTYFRNPFDFVESCYAQFILAGLFRLSRPDFYADGAPSLDKFLTTYAKSRGVALYSNLGLARMLLDAVPRSALTFRSMESDDLNSGSIVEDFCELANVPTPPALPRANRRVSNRKLAELEYVQTLVDHKRYAAVRTALLAHEFPRLKAADNLRSTGLNIGPDLFETISTQAAQERRALSKLFDTGVDALCATPPQQGVLHDLLSDQDRRNIAEFVARQPE